MSGRRQPGARRQHSRRGFALLEVLVSLTLLAVGIVGVLTAVIAALQLQEDAKLRYRAGLILNDRLGETALGAYRGETVRGVSADGLFEWTIAGTPWQGLPREEARQPGEEGTEIADRLCEVRVEVSWRTPRGPRHVQASQLVSLPPGEEVAP